MHSISTSVKICSSHCNRELAAGLPRFSLLVWLVAALTVLHIDCHASARWPIQEAARGSYISYSASGKYAAILQPAKQGCDDCILFTGLTIYSTDENRLPKTRVFAVQSPRSFITNGVWSQETFIYIEYNGDSGGDIVALFGEVGSKGLLDFSRQFSLQAWSASGVRKLGAEVNVFSSIWADRAEGVLLVANPAGHQMTRWMEKERRFQREISDELVIDVIDIALNKAHRTVVRIPVDTTGWLGTWRGVVPLSLVKHQARTQVVVLTRTSVLDKNADTEEEIAPVVATIDLVSGAVKIVTPIDYWNRVDVQQQASRFSLRNPIKTKDSRLLYKVHGAETGGHVVYHGVLADFNGKVLERKVLRRKASPLFNDGDLEVVTWTPDGNKVLLQGRGVWLLNLKDGTHKQIAKDLTVAGLGEWVDETHLTVIGTKLPLEGEPRPSERERVRQLSWFLISTDEVQPGLIPRH